MGSLEWRRGLIGKMRRLPYIDFWVPRYKWELVEWLSKRYPEDRKRFERMEKRRLYAIYFRIRCSG